jgi:hypothetical protein
MLTMGADRFTCIVQDSHLYYATTQIKTVEIDSRTKRVEKGGIQILSAAQMEAGTKKHMA